MKYYEILPTHTEIPRNTTRKIANLYIEFNCHFLTLQKKNPITFEQECILLALCAVSCCLMDKHFMGENTGSTTWWIKVPGIKRRQFILSHNMHNMKLVSTRVELSTW